VNCSLSFRIFRFTPVTFSTTFKTQNKTNIDSHLILGKNHWQSISYYQFSCSRFTLFAIICSTFFLFWIPVSDLDLICPFISELFSIISDSSFSMIYKGTKTMTFLILTYLLPFPLISSFKSLEWIFLRSSCSPLIWITRLFNCGK